VGRQGPHQIARTKGSSGTDLTDFRRFEAEARSRGMTKEEKVRYLRSRRWARISNNRWRHVRTGELLPFGTAVRRQLERDISGA
jgi:hypothetical protein